jgi:hypothetical protein
VHRVRDRVLRLELERLARQLLRVLEAALLERDLRLLQQRVDLRATACLLLGVLLAPLRRARASPASPPPA